MTESPLPPEQTVGRARIRGMNLGVHFSGAVRDLEHLAYLTCESYLPPAVKLVTALYETAPQLVIISELEGLHMVTQLHGEIDAYSTPRFRAHVAVAARHWNRDAPFVWRFDCRGLELVDSAGLGVFSQLHTEMEHRFEGAELHPEEPIVSCVSTPERIRKVFRITGMDKVIPCAPLTPADPPPAR